MFVARPASLWLCCPPLCFSQIKIKTFIRMLDVTMADERLSQHINTHTAEVDVVIISTDVAWLTVHQTCRGRGHSVMSCGC